MLRAVVSLLLQPYLVLTALLALGLFHLWRRRVESRSRLLFVCIPFGLLVVASLPVVGYLAFGSLEWSYPESYKRPAGVEAIVVLGGYVFAPSETRPVAKLAPDSVSRCVFAARLYRMGPRCPVVVTGGRMQPDVPGPSIAEAMGEFLRQYGVDERDLLVESESLNTFENATHTRELLKPLGIRKVLLVSNAIHLRRACWCFEKQGFEVVGAGCDYHAARFDWELGNFLPSAGTVDDLSNVLHEWIGIVYYRANGWL